MTVRIAQISDTHLSRGRPFFIGNFERIADDLRLRKPDIVINSGDLSLDGADVEDDLAFYEWLDTVQSDAGSAG